MDNNEINDIVKQHAPKLHSFVRGRVDNSDDADDIVQDTLYQFLRTIRVLDNPISHVSAWLYTVAHNLIVNHGKKHREVLTDEISSDQSSGFMEEFSEILAADDSDNPEMQMLRSMVWKELHKALEELPCEQRQAVEMTELEGLSVKDAAEKVGVPLSTFLSRKHYAVKHIRKRLFVLYQELTGQA